LKKGKGLNFHPYPELLHFPFVTHPLATILPPVDITSPYSIK